MSRSKRSTPITSMTTAKSEKFDKQMANRKVRREAKKRIKLDEDPKDRKELSDPWCFAKDGKQVFDAKKHPKLMRK